MEVEKELDDNLIDDDDEVEEENVERQLDIEGLARAYKKLSSTKNDGFYKDVLALAISSLCGSLLNLKYLVAKV